MDRLDLLFDSLLAETRLQRGLSIIRVFRFSTENPSVILLFLIIIFFFSRKFCARDFSNIFCLIAMKLSGYVDDINISRRFFQIFKIHFRL